MSTRRDVLKAAGALSAAILSREVCLAAQTQPAPSRGKPRRLRSITYNVLACMGYRKKNDQRRSHRPAIPRDQMTTRFALELGLYQPDIVSFQESPGEQVVADIAEKAGLRHHCFFHSGQAWPGAILSRYRIVEYQNCPLKSFAARPPDLFTRHWGRAVLETDGGELVVYSAHLFPGDSSRRAPEVREMLEVMAADLQSGRSMLLQGDLNHKPDGPEYKRWTEAGLIDTFTAKGVGQPYTIPSHGVEARIDYIWAHGPLTEHLSECRVLYEGAFRTNPDDPGSVALSDHVPVMATFEYQERASRPSVPG
jgi:endonuclease/exonuclease/phosphatase family metal-dependent hydrolase